MINDEFNERTSCMSKKTIELAERANDLLKGKTIIGVEPGTTQGWIVINFQPTDPFVREFITLWMGTTTTEDGNHFSDVNVHEVTPERTGWVYPLRKFDVKDTSGDQ